MSTNKYLRGTFNGSAKGQSFDPMFLHDHRWSGTMKVASSASPTAMRWRWRVMATRPCVSVSRFPRMLVTTHAAPPIWWDGMPAPPSCLSRKWVSSTTHRMLPLTLCARWWEGTHSCSVTADSQGSVFRLDKMNLVSGDFELRNNSGSA